MYRGYVWKKIGGWILDDLIKRDLRKLYVPGP